MSERVKYVLVPADSIVRIHATSSLHPIDGQSSGIEGEIEFTLAEDGRPDLNHPVEAHIELPVSRLESGNAAYDKEMKRRLDERKYPKITGQLTKVEETSTTDTYHVTGNLTFHGATRTVEADISVDLDESERLSASWTQTIDIRNFNMKPPRILMLKVDPEVRIEVDLTAEKA